MLETLDFQMTWISHVRDFPSRFSPWERSQLRAIRGSQGGVVGRPVDSGLSLYETITGREVSLEDYVDGESLNAEDLKGIHLEATVNLTLDMATRR
jgi:hypothetical protein